MKLDRYIHQNYADASGNVYCRRLHKVAKLLGTETNCHSCPMFFGCLQGQGVECYWKDVDEISAESPAKELLRVSQLIDQGVIHKEDI